MLECVGRQFVSSSHDLFRAINTEENHVAIRLLTYSRVV